jgi:4-amino-4-deoxy-L-arabinose transferase-like glycosyltransferase
LGAVNDTLRGGTVPMLDIKERALVERIVAKDALKFGFLVWLAVRIVLCIWGTVILTLAPADSHDHIRRDYPDVVLPTHDLYGYTLGVWNIYDTRHYITIAERGYEADPGWLPVYFPGYPLLIKAVSPFMLGNSLLAAMLIANLAAIIFFWYLYRLVEPEYGEEVAKRAVVLSAIFPSSFFLFMGYTESLLLALIVMAFYYARQQKWWLAGLLAGGAALVKQPGIFLLVPLIFMYWQQYRLNRAAWTLRQKLSGVSLLLSPLAALSYSLYRYLYLAAPISDAGDVGGGQRVTFPGVPLLNALGEVRADNPLLAYNLMDIGFTLLMVGLLVGIALKIRSTPYLLYSLTIGIVNLGTYMWTYGYRPEVNMPRRMLLIFPIFIFLALALRKPRAYRMALYVASTVFLCLSGLFINWVFVS